MQYRLQVFEGIVGHGLLGRPDRIDGGAKVSSRWSGLSASRSSLTKHSR